MVERRVSSGLQEDARHRGGGSEVRYMTQQPVVRFGVGQVSCAVWENEISVNSQAETILKASVSRRYRDYNGEWKSSTSFSRNEILLAIYCLQKAFALMVEGDNDGEGVFDENRAG
jgi:hypothetical protein